MTNPVAPDDTPRRLKRLRAFCAVRSDVCHRLSRGAACECPRCDLAWLIDAWSDAMKELNNGRP